MIYNLIMWLGICVAMGVAEAIFYRAHTRIPGKADEHGYYFVVRLLCAAAIFTHPLALLGAGLVFPFFHDGAYYETRKRLDNIYPAGFLTDKPLGSTAKFSLGIVLRSLMAAAGLALLIWR